MKWTLLWLALLPAWAGADIIEEGEPAPPFALPSLTQEATTVSLDSLRGQVLYVDFWASWCGPCRVSFPILDALRADFKDQGFEVVAINVDEYREDALEFLAELPVDYPVVYDAESVTPEAYGILGMPTGFLIDRTGTVRKVHQGFRKSDAEKLRTEVLQLLGE